jgi:hypothetical protein
VALLKQEGRQGGRTKTGSDRQPGHPQPTDHPHHQTHASVHAYKEESKGERQRKSDGKESGESEQEQGGVGPAVRCKRA